MKKIKIGTGGNITVTETVTKDVKYDEKKFYSPIRLMFVIDQSKTMFGCLEEVSNCMEEIREVLRPMDFVGCVLFGGKAKNCLPFVRNTYVDKDRLKKQLLNKINDRGKSLYDGIILGLENLSSHYEKVMKEWKLIENDSDKMKNPYFTCNEPEKGIYELIVVTGGEESGRSISKAFEVDKKIGELIFFLPNFHVSQINASQIYYHEINSSEIDFGKNCFYSEPTNIKDLKICFSEISNRIKKVTGNNKNTATATVSKETEFTFTDPSKATEHSRSITINGDFDVLDVLKKFSNSPNKLTSVADSVYSVDSKKNDGSKSLFKKGVHYNIIPPSRQEKITLVEIKKRGIVIHEEKYYEPALDFSKEPKTVLQHQVNSRCLYMGMIPEVFFERSKIEKYFGNYDIGISKIVPIEKPNRFSAFIRFQSDSCVIKALEKQGDLFGNPKTHFGVMDPKKVQKVFFVGPGESAPRKLTNKGAPRGTPRGGFRGGGFRKRRGSRGGGRGKYFKGNNIVQDGEKYSHRQSRNNRNQVVVNSKPNPPGFVVVCANQDGPQPSSHPKVSFRNVILVSDVSNNDNNNDNDNDMSSDSDYQSYTRPAPPPVQRRGNRNRNRNRNRRGSGGGRGGSGAGRNYY